MTNIAQDFEFETPLTTDEYFYSQLSAGSRSAIEDITKIDSSMGDLLRSLALTAYAKGRKDEADEVVLQLSGRKPEGIVL